MKTIEDCNCITCINKKCVFWIHREEARSTHDQYGVMLSPHMITGGVGCLSHKDAKEALMAGAIKELLARKKNCDDVKAKLPIGSESHSQLSIAAKTFHEAIKIITGDY